MELIILIGGSVSGLALVFAWWAYTQAQIELEAYAALLEKSERMPVEKINSSFVSAKTALINPSWYIINAIIDAEITSFLMLAVFVLIVFAVYILPKMFFELFPY